MSGTAAAFIGLMSGSSLDGVDGVLARIDASGRQVGPHAHAHLPLPAALRQQLLALQTSGPDELQRSAVATDALMTLYAAVVDRLQAEARAAGLHVRAIGAHGQTVRHQPQAFGDHGYSWQLMNGARLAELCGVDVVCDFRSRDLAAGGEGAPLVPAFHAALWARPGRALAVLNLGGIANLTLLHADGSVGGFDTGPGNVLMDLWCQRHTGLAFDRDGAWAAGGQVQAELLQRWLAEPYFKRAAPKSTGRDLFNADWLERQLPAQRQDDGSAAGCAADQSSTAGSRAVMATLAALTASTVVQALNDHLPAAQQLLVCGGGARNAHVMALLRAELDRTRGPNQVPVSDSCSAGVEPEQVEALAFAWLAGEHLAGRCGNLAAVTGSRGRRRLGALYPA